MRKLLVVLSCFLLPLALVATVPRQGTVTTTYDVAAPGSAPTAALANLGAGLVTSGTHSYKITALDAGGETLPTSASAVVTTATATNGKVYITVPTFVTGQTGANVYRTATGDAGDYLLVNSSPITSAGDYLDNVADGSLGAAAPSSNTTTTPLTDPTDPPVVALWNGGAGLCYDGAHLFKIAYATADGPGPLSAASSSVTTAAATNGVVNITPAAASTNPSVTGIYVYMTKADETDYFYAATIANDTNAHEVSVADTSLVTEWANTSAHDTFLSPTGISGYWGVYLRNNDSSLPVYVSFDNSVVDTTNGFWIGPEKDVLFPCPIPLPGDGIRLRSTTAGVSVTYAFWPK